MAHQVHAGEVAADLGGRRPLCGPRPAWPSAQPAAARWRLRRGGPEPPSPQNCRRAAGLWSPMAAALSAPRFRTGLTTVAAGRGPASPAKQDAIISCNVLITAAAIHTERGASHPQNLLEIHYSHQAR